MKDTCKEFNIRLKKIQNPPNTRWSGYHKNLSSVLYLKTALAQLTSDLDNWGEFQLSVNDWKLVETAVELLKPFKDTIEIWQAEKEPTMHRVIERLYTLNALLTQFLQKNRNNKIGSSFAKALQQSLNTRFPNNGTENALRRIANYIAPQYKGIHLENELELVKSDIKNTFVSDDHPNSADFSLIIRIFEYFALFEYSNIDFLKTNIIRYSYSSNFDFRILFVIRIRPIFIIRFNTDNNFPKTKFKKVCQYQCLQY